MSERPNSVAPVHLTCSSKKIPESCPKSATYHPVAYINESRSVSSKPAHPPDLSGKKPQSDTCKTPTHHQSTPTGKEDRALKRDMFDALKKAEKMKNLELLAVRNQFDSKIKALQHELKECQKNCKQLEMQVVAQSREVSADEKKLFSSRQAAQMPKTTMAGRKTVDSIPTSSVQPIKESSTRCTPTVANEDQIQERLKMEMVQDKAVAKVKAEVLKEKENEIKKVKEDMSRETERIYSAAQEEKRIAVEKAVAQVLKVNEKEINRVKDELHRCEELDRVKAERVKEMEEMRARLHRQNESMDSLRAGQLKAKEADKAKTEMRRELAEQMQKFKAEVMKQKDKEMDELRATLLKKEQEIDKVRDELITECQQQMEQLKVNMMKEKRKEMDVLRTELLREKEREIHEAKAEMTQKTAREIEQLKIEVMKDKGKEQWKGREREIGKLRTELAIERDRKVKSLKTKIMEENQKEIERMRAMLLRDLEEEIVKFKAEMITLIEREMEKFVVKKNKIELALKEE